MPGRSRHPFLALLVAGMLVLAACGSSDDDSSSPDPDGDTDPTEVTTTTEPETIDCSVYEIEDRSAPDVPELDADLDEIEVEEITDGEEDACPFHTLGFATIDLIGTTVDGDTFLDTWEEERPLSVQPATLLPALDDVLSGMVVGDVRSVAIPATQAYGENGNDFLGIGPNEPIRFTMQLTAVTEDRAYCSKPQPLPNAGQDGKPESVDIPVIPPTEVETEDLEPGEGVEARVGDAVSLQYVGVSCAYGWQFDSSYDSGRSLDVDAIGTGLIDGFSEGLVGVREGMVRIIRIPSEAAYGPVAPSPQIAADDDLIFHVTIESVTPAGEVTDDGDDADDGIEIAPDVDED